MWAKLQPGAGSKRHLPAVETAQIKVSALGTSRSASGISSEGVFERGQRGHGSLGSVGKAANS